MSINSLFYLQSKETMSSPGVEANKALFLEKVRQSNSACQVGLYYNMVGFNYIIMPGGGLPDGPVPVQ